MDSEERAKQAEAKLRAVERMRRGRRTQQERAREKQKRKQFEKKRDFDYSLFEPLQDASIIQFASNPLFLGLRLYPGQEILLRAMYGLPIPERLMPLYLEMTHLPQAPEAVTRELSEVWETGQEKTEAVWVLGRRGTKSTTAAIIALYEATRLHWREDLMPGEWGVGIIIATSREQAEEIIGDGCQRLLADAGTLLRGIVHGAPTRRSVSLKNGIKISSYPTNTRAPRGKPTIFLVMDEVGWFFVDGPKADESIFGAIEPGMAQFRGRAKFLLISSPAAKQGLLWNRYREGHVPDRLTCQAPTGRMNPTVDPEWLKKKFAQNPDGARREYGAQFDEKVEALYTEGLLDASTVIVGDQPYNPVWSYVGGLDASGLAGRDRFGFAIAHAGLKEVVHVDLCRAWDSRDAEEIFGEIGALCKSYAVTTVYVDQFAMGYVASGLQKKGVEVVKRPPLATVHVNAKNLMLGKKCELPLDEELKDGLLKTQIFYSRSNQPTVGRERSSEGHGDKADAVVSAIWGATQEEQAPKEEIVNFDAVEYFGPVSPMLEEGDERVVRAYPEMCFVFRVGRFYWYSGAGFFETRLDPGHRSEKGRSAPAALFS